MIVTELSRKFSFLMTATLALSAVVVLFGCSGPSTAGGTFVISSSGGLTASSGTLSNTGGNWSFDAGTIPQYTTENVTITVTNSGSGDFVAQGSASFTPSGDFATSLGGSFTVKAHSSNSFTVSFTPASFPGPESGTLTLSPSGGNPIAISLTVATDQAFQLFDVSRSQIIPGTPGSVYTGEGGTSNGLYIYNADNGSTSISLTGSPYVSISGTGYSVNTQPPPTDFPLTYDNSAYIYLTDSNSTGGNLATITISGTDSTTNAPFVFTCTVVDNAG